MTPIRSPLQAQIVQWLVVPGDAVQAGDLLVILEAMKMEHEVRAGHSRSVVMAYDATVLAGTQGMRNHQKTDRMLGIALQQKLPVVLFAEGGGGRPGDVDMPIVAGLHVATFASYARLNGQVRIPAIVTSDSGRS